MGMSTPCEPISVMRIAQGSRPKKFATRNFFEEIELRPAMPDISGSLIALRERLQAGAAEQ